MGGLVVYAFWSVIYSFVFLFCFIFHFLLIRSRFYSKQRNLILGLVIFDLLAVLGVYVFLVFIYSSAFLSTGYVLFFFGITGIPIWQYGRANQTLRLRQTNFVWIVGCHALLYLGMLMFFYKPIVSHEISSYKNERSKIENQQRKDDRINAKELLHKNTLQRKVDARLRSLTNQKDRLQTNQSEYFELLKIILDQDKIQMVRLKNLEMSEIKDLAAQGAVIQSIDSYFVDELCETDEPDVIDPLKLLFLDPDIYDFEDTTVLNPFYKSSTDPFAVIFKSQKSMIRLMIYFDTQQITVVYGLKTKVAKLIDTNLLRKVLKDQSCFNES